MTCRTNTAKVLSVRIWSRNVRRARDHVPVVERVTQADDARRSPECAEISYDSIAPKKRMYGRVDEFVPSVLRGQLNRDRQRGE